MIPGDGYGGVCPSCGIMAVDREAIRDNGRIIGTTYWCAVCGCGMGATYDPEWLKEAEERDAANADHESYRFAVLVYGRAHYAHPDWQGRTAAPYTDWHDLDSWPTYEEAKAAYDKALADPAEMDRLMRRGNFASLDWDGRVAIGVMYEHPDPWRCSYYPIPDASYADWGEKWVVEDAIITFEGEAPVLRYRRVAECRRFPDAIELAKAVGPMTRLLRHTDRVPHEYETLPQYEIDYLVRYYARKEAVA